RSPANNVKDTDPMSHHFFIAHRPSRSKLFVRAGPSARIHAAGPTERKLRLRGHPLDQRAILLLIRAWNPRLRAGLGSPHRKPSTGPRPFSACRRAGRESARAIPFPAPLGETRLTEPCGMSPAPPPSAAPGECGH